MNSKKWHVANRLQHALLLSRRLEASFSPLGVTGSGLTELSRIMQSGFEQSLHFVLKIRTVGYSALSHL